MIRKFSPIDQNAKNLLKIHDYEDPALKKGTIAIDSYSVTIDVTSVTSIVSIRFTLPGGSVATYALGTHATTTAAGRLSFIQAVDAQLALLGYDSGIGVKIDGDDMTVYTDFSEIVFVGLNASGNAFAASGSPITVGV